MNRLRENDNNDIEAIDETGAVLESIEGWTPAEPFFMFERKVTTLAARHAAGSAQAPGHEFATIHEFLVDQEELYNKAVHDIATDNQLDF